jgi:hypothetical protein
MDADLNWRNAANFRQFEQLKAHFFVICGRKFPGREFPSITIFFGSYRFLKRKSSQWMARKLTKFNNKRP